MRPENEHMLAVLKDLMEHLGLSYRDVERELGLGASYFSRLFDGTMRLRYEHIADIAGVLGLGIEEVMRFAYPRLPQPPSEAAARLRELLGDWVEPAAAPFPTLEDLESLAARTLRRLFGELARPGEG